MDWKLFASTFALIFLAELGDKTQLTVLAASAGATETRSIVSVTIGAILALTLSTLVAVAVASLLNRTLPEHWLQAGAAVLFLAFGLVLARTAVQGFRGAEAPAPAPGVAPSTEAELPESAFGRWVMREAGVFEEELLEDLDHLIELTGPGPLRRKLETLAAEEREHVESLGEVRPHRREPIHREPELAIEEVPRAKTAEGESLLHNILQRERAIQAFYTGLARATHVPGLRTLFARLAEEERDHIRRWETMIEEMG